LPDSFVAQLLELQRTNPYYYTIYALGKWGNKTSEGNFYKLFKRLKNARPDNECMYNPNLPLCLTFDFNVHPYVTLNIHQVVGKRATQIDEICLPTPDNRTDLACRKFAARYAAHTAGVWVYGDPAGLHEDTRTEKGYNDFIIIMNELKAFRPVAKWGENRHFESKGYEIVQCADIATDDVIKEIKISRAKYDLNNALHCQRLAADELVSCNENVSHFERMLKELEA